MPISARNGSSWLATSTRTAVLPQGRDQLGHAVQVQAVGRLVHDQQLGRRLGQQQRGQSRPEPLAAGQRADGPTYGVGAQQEAGQPGAQRVVVGRRGEVGHGRQHGLGVGKQVQPLRQHAYGHQGPHRAGPRRQRAGGRVDQRGLARPVGSGHRHSLRSSEVQRDRSSVAEHDLVEDENVAAGRDRGTGQVDADEVVVADLVLSSAERLLGLGHVGLVTAAELAGRDLGRALLGSGYDLRHVVGLAAGVAQPPVEPHPSLGQLTLLPPQVLLGHRVRTAPPPPARRRAPR